MVTVLAFLFVFSLIVVVHELGHFWAARLFSVRIDTFSLGFGPPLLSIPDKHGTMWRLRALPLGGYVKFFGDAGAASNPDTDRLTQLAAQIESEHGREALESCYHFKPVWQRATIAAAGPVANFVLAFVIFTIAVAITGMSGYPPIVGSVAPGTAAEAAGLRSGDLITHIRGRPIRYYVDVQRFAQLSAGDDAVITVERDGRVLDFPVTIGRRVAVDPFGGESALGYLGVSLGLTPTMRAPAPGSPAEAAGVEAGDRIIAVAGRPVSYFIQVQEYLDAAEPGPIPITVERDGAPVVLTPVLEAPPAEDAAEDAADAAAPPRAPYLGLLLDVSDQVIGERPGPAGAVARGAAWTWDAAAAPVLYVSRMVRGRESGRELGGILRIGKFAGAMAQDGYVQGASGGGGVLGGLGGALSRLVLLAGALSVSIGLINLLPIPILDGGHLVYYGYEAVAGRPLGEGAQEWGFRIGLALVLGLMIFATWNDLRYLRVFEAIGNILS